MFKLLITIITTITGDALLTSSVLQYQLGSINKMNTLGLTGQTHEFEHLTNLFSKSYIEHLGYTHRLCASVPT